MNRVYLHGALSDFGAFFDLDVDTPREAVKALIVNLGEPFKQALRDGEFQVVRRPRGDTSRGDRPGYYFDDHNLAAQMALRMNESELHVIPVPAGSKNQGVGKVLLGIALVGAAIISAGATAGFSAGLGGALSSTVGLGAFSFISAGNVALFGAAIALGGVAMMVAPSPKAQGPQERDQNASFLFNGVVNVQEQGNAIPLVYGQFLVGSVVISSGVSAEAVRGVSGGAVSTDPYGTGGAWDSANDLAFTRLF